MSRRFGKDGFDEDFCFEEVEDVEDEVGSADAMLITWDEVSQERETYRRKDCSARESAAWGLVEDLKEYPMGMFLCCCGGGGVGDSETDEDDEDEEEVEEEDDDDDDDDDDSFRGDESDRSRSYASVSSFWIDVAE